jgi:hypothetical protein
MTMAALAITCTGLIPAAAPAQDTQDLIETVGAMILADRLGIDPNIILMSKLSGGGSVFDMAPALALGAYGNGDLGSVLGMQGAGYGWNDIAGYTSVPEPTYISLQRTRSLDNDYVWSDELGTRYSVGQERLQALRRAGYTWHEIAQALVESQETGQPVEEALYENRIYGVNREPIYGDLYRPVYVPPRSTVLFASALPAPRIDWRYAGPVFQPQPTLWVNNWIPVRRSRPVVTRWSDARVVRQPLYVLDDGVFRRVQQPLYRLPAKTRYVSTKVVRVAPIRFVEPVRQFLRPATQTRYAVRNVVTTDGRAQRFGEIRRVEAWKNQERAHRARDLRAAEREQAKVNDRLRQDQVRKDRKSDLDRARKQEVQRNQARRVANERSEIKAKPAKQVPNRQAAELKRDKARAQHRKTAPQRKTAPKRADKRKDIQARQQHQTKVRAESKQHARVKAERAPARTIKSKATVRAGVKAQKSTARPHERASHVKAKQTVRATVKVHKGTAKGTAKGTGKGKRKGG